MWIALAVLTLAATLQFLNGLNASLSFILPPSVFILILEANFDLPPPFFSVFIEYFVVGVFYLWWPSTNCGVLCTELILMCCRATPNTSPVFYNSPRDGCSPRCFGFKPLFLFSSGCASYSFPIGDYCRQHQLSSFLSLSTEHLCMVELRANRHTWWIARRNS